MRFRNHLSVNLLAQGLISIVISLGGSRAMAQKPPEWVLQKPSIKELSGLIKRSEQIENLYNSTLLNSEFNEKSFPKKAVDELLKQNESVLRVMTDSGRNSLPFVRGEIEDSANEKGLYQLVKLSMLKARGFLAQKKYLQAKDEWSIWFLFAADFCFEEATLKGLQVSHQIRKMIMDELESFQKKFPEVLGQDELWLVWAQSLKTPWPIERVILSEGRRLIRARYNMPAVDGFSRELQKNPYQSMTTLFSKVKGGKAQELQILKDIWKDSDIAEMKLEQNQIQNLRIRIAAGLYTKKIGKKPESIADLIKAGYFVSPPVDYFTLKPLPLTF